jgi:hypothetical protein
VGHHQFRAEQHLNGEGKVKERKMSL